MSLKSFFSIVTMLSALTIISCGGSSSSDSSLDPTTVGDTFNAASDAVDDATSGMNDKNISGMPVTFHIQAPDEFRDTPTFKERLYAIIDDWSMKSAAWAAMARWVYPPDIYTYPADLTTNPANFDVYKNFTTTAAPNYSERTATSRQVTGYALLKWTGLSAGKPTAGTQLLQAPHKTLKKPGADNYVTVDGYSDTTITVDSSTGAPADALPIGHSITWSSETESIVSIDLVRKKFSSKGTQKSGHIVSTSTPLSMSVDKTTTYTRTIKSGTILVNNQLSNYNSTFTFDNVIYELYTGNPVSGTVTVTITKDGSEIGTGTITYSSGVESYSFTINGETTTGTIEM